MGGGPLAVDMGILIGTGTTGTMPPIMEGIGMGMDTRTFMG
jgi:hypothetical protein